jgi:hypothetical protein
MITTDTFRHDSEIVRLVRAFEASSLPRHEWTHAAQLTVALWYMSRYEELDATERVIRGLRRFNRAHRVVPAADEGYHETLTLFWLGITRAYLASADPATSTLDLFNEFIRRYGGREGMFREYYSNALIRSCEARYAWAEPDLKPIDF